VDRRRGDTGRAVRSDCAHEAELRQRRHAIVQADLFCDLAVFDTKDCRSGEPHLPARARRERTLKKVTERRAGVCATANPTTDDGNLIHFNELPKGGHFAAWEQPQLFSEEVRAGFRSLRG
jgi:hypothetical protein